MLFQVEDGVLRKSLPRHGDGKEEAKEAMNSSDRPIVGKDTAIA